MDMKRIHVESMLGTFDQLNVDRPDGLAELADRHATILANQANHPPASVLDAYLAALAADRDPGTDPAVQAAVVGQRAAEIQPAVRARFQAETVDAIRADPDAVIDAWRPAFDTAAEGLTAAHRILGGAPLDDEAALLRRGGSAAQAFVNAGECLRILGTVAGGWGHLAAVLGHRRLAAQHARLWMVTITDPAEAAELDLSGTHKKGDPWAALSDGLTLNLSTPGQARTTSRAIDAHNRAAAAAPAPMRTAVA